LFTTERGKIDVIAKGARRSKSHLGGRLQFTNEVLLGMHRGRNLDVVVSADTQEAHWERIVQPERFTAANMIAELIDSFCEPDLPLPEVYALLTGALRAIGASENPIGLLPRFSLRLLHVLGLAPPTDSCIRCGKALSGGAWVDAEQGGFAGEECRAAWKEALWLESADLENIRALALRRGTGAAARAAPRAAEAVAALVAGHLGKRPKTVMHAAELAAPSA